MEIIRNCGTKRNLIGNESKNPSLHQLDRTMTFQIFPLVILTRPCLARNYLWVWLLSSCSVSQSNRISECKIFIYFTRKNLLFYLFYTPIFTKHPHQFIYSTHLFYKIFISLTLSSLSQTQHNPHSHYHQPPSLTQPYEIQKLIQPSRMKSQNPLIKQRIKNGSKPTYQDRRLALSNKIDASDLPLCNKINISFLLAISTQRKTKSTPFNSKPTDQTTRNKGKRSTIKEASARDQSDWRLESAISGSGYTKWRW